MLVLNIMTVSKIIKVLIEVNLCEPHPNCVYEKIAVPTCLNKYVHSCRNNYYIIAVHGCCVFVSCSLLCFDNFHLVYSLVLGANSLPRNYPNGVVDLCWDYMCGLLDVTWKKP